MVDDKENKNEEPEEKDLPSEEAAEKAPVEEEHVEEEIVEEEHVEEEQVNEEQFNESQTDESHVEEEHVDETEDNPFGEIDEEDKEEVENIVEEEVIEEVAKEAKAIPEVKKAPAVEEPKHEIEALNLEPHLVAGKLKTSDIPVTMVVELAQLEISTQKLLELQPGNMLELTGHSNNIVYLVINRKIMGKGELIKIGDTLGIRIIELGT